MPFRIVQGGFSMSTTKRILLILLVSFFGIGLAFSQGTKDEQNEKVELVLWDLHTDGPAAAMVDKIVADYMAKNPNVTVTHSAFKVEDLRNIIKPAINSGKGPDVFSYDAGAGYLGVLAGSSLAYDMTDYAKQHDWYQKFFDWGLAKSTFGGRLYGVTNQLELLGFFYNKDIFAKAGVTPPSSYAQFLDVAKALKAKGYLPIILPDKDQWPGFHYESIWLNSFAGPDMVKKAVKTEISWETPIFAEALDEFSRLVASGLTSDKPLGLSYQDALNSFYAGGGAMIPTGTWIVGEAVANMKDNVGYFFLPAAKPGVPNSPPGGFGEALVVNAKSKHPLIALDFIDFMFSESQIKTIYEVGGFIPAVNDVDVSKLDIPGLLKDVIKEIDSAQTLGENIDVLMPPKVNEVTANYIQEIIAGKKTGALALAEKQQALLEDIAAGNFTVE